MITALLLLSALVTVPTGSLDIALAVVVAVAALAVATGRTVPLGLRPGLHTSGPRDEERHLRGSFRRQHRPDAPGRPQSRAPGVMAGAL
ncbi:DUF6412 domain-containing protein [Rhodococcoides yunnanense]|uniref:DUF6412 domain-containing protein n=1 Tax=Rhodococcoides yunnanense TaxID=278209 RepID=UPI001475C1AB|nr:DUF6412 domain-containing protein [Rhodococcus yunnanensis]